MAEPLDCVYGVVGAAIRSRRVEGGGLQPGACGAEKLDHSETIGEAGVRTILLERLDACWRNENAIKMEAITRSFRDG